MVVAADKPPYLVPLMEEIRGRDTNGYKVVSTFSGCGGSCLGFKMAGFEALYASEFIPAARETYEKNFPGVPVDDRDIRDVTPEEILEKIGLRAGEIDVLEGSPPCASFSTAGKREQGWNKVKNYSDTKQRVDDLFFEFARILRGLQPKVFVAENVSGLVKGVAKGYFKEILRALKGCGYTIQVRLLDAQWLGVPQTRQRVIFIGVRDDLVEKRGVGPVFPKPLAYRYSVRDALPHIGEVTIGGTPDNWQDASQRPSPAIAQSDHSSGRSRWFSGGGFVAAETEPPAHVEERVPVRVVHDTSGEYGQGDITDRPAPAVTVGMDSMNSGHFRVEEEVRIVEGDISDHKIAEEWDKLEPGQSSEKYYNLTKPHPDAPSPTVTQMGGNLGMASVVHPYERRKFTIAELRRICSFPDDFEFVGTYKQNWERMGRSVPPVMMSHVAAAIKTGILDRITAAEGEC